MSKKFLIIVIILIAVGIMIGYFIGENTGEKAGYEKGYQESWNLAKEKVDQSKLIPSGPKEVFNIRGEILKIEGEVIYLKAKPVSINPLEEQGPVERKVIVTDQTEFTKKIAKTPSEIQEEIAGRVKAGTPTPPNLYKEESADFSDLKPGAQISVSAQENIKFKEEFKATTIAVFE